MTLCLIGAYDWVGIDGLPRITQALIFFGLLFGALAPIPIAFLLPGCNVGSCDVFVLFLLLLLFLILLILLLLIYIFILCVSLIDDFIEDVDIGLHTRTQASRRSCYAHKIQPDDCATHIKDNADDTIPDRCRMAFHRTHCACPH